MTDTLARTAAMRQHQSTVSQDKHRAVRAAVDRSVATGVALSAAALARSARVAETFLYRHQAQPCPICETVFGTGPLTYHHAQMAAIADARDTHAKHLGRVTTASLHADLANQRAINQRLRKQIQALENRLGELVGTHAETDLGELARLTHDHAPDSAPRIRQLTDQIGELTARIAEQDEELVAVRRLNADLTRRLNGAFASTDGSGVG